MQTPWTTGIRNLSLANVVFLNCTHVALIGRVQKTGHENTIWIKAMEKNTRNTVDLDESVIITPGVDLVLRGVTPGVAD